MTELKMNFRGYLVRGEDKILKALKKSNIMFETFENGDVFQTEIGEKYYVLSVNHIHQTILFISEKEYENSPISR